MYVPVHVLFDSLCHESQNARFKCVGFTGKKNMLLHGKKGVVQDAARAGAVLHPSLNIT